MSVISSISQETPTYFLSETNPKTQPIVEELNRIFAIECIVNLHKGKEVYTLIETNFKYKVSDLSLIYRDICVQNDIPSSATLETRIDCLFVKEKTQQAFQNALVGKLNVDTIHFRDDYYYSDMEVFQGYRITLVKP